MLWQCQLQLMNRAMPAVLALARLSCTLTLDWCLPSRSHATPWPCQLPLGSRAMQAVLALVQLA